MITPARLNRYARLFDFFGFEIIEVPADGRVKFRFGSDEPVLQFDERKVEIFQKSNSEHLLPDPDDLPAIKYFIVLDVLIHGMDVCHYLLTDGEHRREIPI